jgi:hypothetical protein
VTAAMQRRDKHSPTTIVGQRFLCGPRRGVILKTSGATQSVSGWQSSKRIETISTAEYLLCEFKTSLGVCDPDYV